MPAGIKLLAGIAHDLRTPLARLRLRAELDCPEEVSRAMEEDFQTVTHLIEQILGYAQGCMAPSSQGFGSLHELVRRGVSSYRQVQSDVGLGSLEARDVVVPCLPLQRVLANLVDNALAHGAAPVWVEVQADAAGVALLVFDHGPGLSHEQLLKATQPFVQLGMQVSPTQSLGRCGLGLAIVAQIAQQLGGRVVLKPFNGTRSGIGVHIPG